MKEHLKAYYAHKLALELKRKGQANAHVIAYYRHKVASGD